MPKNPRGISNKILLATALADYSVFVQKFEWGNDKLKDIKLENSFKKTVDFSKEKLDVLVGADVIYWPQYLPDLFQTIKVKLFYFLHLLNHVMSRKL